MKLEKETEQGRAIVGRWYDDACGAALALELVGERWALLVIRELMFGPRRFSDLKADLTGISANVLTQRLAGLERVGVLHKCQLPPPAQVQAYELTAWGYEAEPIFQVLGRWAVRSPLHDPTRPLSAVSTMLSLRTMLRPDRAPLTMSVAFRFPGSTFIGQLSSAGLAIERGDSDVVDVVFDTDTTTTFAGLVYGGLSFDEAEAAGVLRLTGDRGLAARFIGCFTLPDKIEAGAR